MTKYVSIDTETTGLNPSNCQLLEIGLVIFDSQETNFKQTSNNSLRIVLVREELKGYIFAFNMNQSLIKEMIDFTPNFDLPNADSVIEKVTEDLTTLYVDMRSKNLLDELYGCEDYDSLKILQYKITEFLSKAKVKGKLNIVGKNFSSFDKGFLEKYNCFKSTILDRARHRVLDVGSMYVTPEDEFLPDLKTCLTRAMFENVVPHTAVEDAVLVVKAALYKFNSMSNFN